MLRINRNPSKLFPVERGVIAHRVCAAGNGARPDGISHEFTRTRIWVRAISEHTVRSTARRNVQTYDRSLAVAKANDRNISRDEIGAERFRRRIGRRQNLAVRKEAHITARLSERNLIRVGEVTGDHGRSEIESRTAAGRQLCRAIGREVRIERSGVTS